MCPFNFKVQQAIITTVSLTSGANHRGSFLLVCPNELQLLENR